MSLMKRHGQYSDQQKFIKIHENMLPGYKLYGLRENVTDLGELIKATVEY